MAGALVLLVLGLVALVVGADFAVRAAQRMARRLGVSDLVVGLTVTSIGTSLPELATTAGGALASGGEGGMDAAGVAVGNILGSNLFLLTALLGASGIVTGLTVKRETLVRDGSVLAAATVAMLVVCLGGQVTRAEGLVLVGAYAAYLFWVVRQEHARVAEIALSEPVESTWSRDLGGLVGGLAVLIVGANLVVDRGVFVAGEIGVPGTLIGVFVGIGTSLPELVVSLQAARSGAVDISLGNIVGSAVTNLLLCFGFGAAVYPLPVPPGALAFDFPFLAASTVIALALMADNRDVTRLEGVSLATLFVLYLYLRTTLIGG